MSESAPLSNASVPSPATGDPIRRVHYRRTLAKAAILLTALIIWQGLVRRPTAPAYGTSFHSVPFAITNDGGPTLHVSTFNIAGGVWPGDNRLDLSRTAKYLHSFDIVGLEEVHGAQIVDWRDQAQILGESLHMPWLYAPSERRWWHDSFGNATLCDLPVTRWERLPLSTSLSASNRSMLRLFLTWHNHPLTVIITHLDRHEDHDIELGAVIASFDDSPLPVILLGDLNTDTLDPQLAALRKDPTVTDALGQVLKAAVPSGNVDWIFARGLKCTDAGFTDNDASDHKLAWATLAEPQ